MMKHIGIIAEYNPFHNGHAYQFSQIKKDFPDKKIVICLSGDYVQRGEPCIFPKSLRCKCTLNGGADLVIEMPILYSSASSEHFATAGVMTLYKTGIVDTICFGAECDDKEKLIFLAELFLNEPDDYKVALKSNLSLGLSFPKARYNAVKTCFPGMNYETILESPNNILAIEYIKAIRKFNLPLDIHIIKRSHDNHNILSTENNICSSSALRNTFTSDNIDYNSWNNNIPENVLDTIKESPVSKPLFLDDYYSYLQYKLISDIESINDYFEMTEELSNTIKNLSIIPSSFNELIDILSSKHNTKARVRRALFNVILSRSKQLIKEYPPEKVCYIRLLGVRSDSTHLIKDMKDFCDIPVINKTSIAKNILSQNELKLFLREIYENKLYRQIFYNKYGITLPTDYEQSVIIL